MSKFKIIRNIVISLTILFFGIDKYAYTFFYDEESIDFCSEKGNLSASFIQSKSFRNCISNPDVRRQVLNILIDKEKQRLNNRVKYLDKNYEILSKEFMKSVHQIGEGKFINLKKEMILPFVGDQEELPPFFKVKMKNCLFVLIDNVDSITCFKQQVDVNTEAKTYVNFLDSDSLVSNDNPEFEWQFFYSYSDDLPVEIYVRNSFIKANEYSVMFDENRLHLAGLKISKENFSRSINDFYSRRITRLKKASNLSF